MKDKKLSAAQRIKLCELLIKNAERIADALEMQNEGKHWRGVSDYDLFANDMLERMRKDG